jgi:hypothetical protein
MRTVAQYLEITQAEYQGFILTGEFHDEQSLQNLSNHISLPCHVIVVMMEGRPQDISNYTYSQ